MALIHISRLLIALDKPEKSLHSRALSGPPDGFPSRKLFVSCLILPEHRAVYGNPLDAVNLSDRRVLS